MEYRRMRACWLCYRVYFQTPVVLSNKLNKVFLVCSHYLLMFCFERVCCHVALTSLCQHQTELLTQEKEIIHTLILQQNNKLSSGVAASQSQILLRSILGKRNLFPLPCVVAKQNLAACLKIQMQFETGLHLLRNSSHVLLSDVIS